MIAVQATYDGKEFKPLLSESFPKVATEVKVAIVFLENETTSAESQKDIFLRMRAARDAMPPLGMDIREMIEEGRER
jgi:hypothetical protein